MKKFILLTIFSILFSFAYAQQFGIELDFNQNTYFSPKKNVGHYFHKFKKEYGFSLGFVAKDLFIKNTKFALTYTLSNGSFFNTDGSLGGGRTYTVDASRSTIDFTFYPVDITFLKRFNLSVGLDVNYLLNSNLNGIHHFWRIDIGSEENDINDEENFINPVNAGIVGQLGYNFIQTKSLKCQLFFKSYLNVTRTFKITDAPIGSRRFSIGFAVLRNSD